MRPASIGKKIARFVFLLLVLMAVEWAAIKLIASMSNAGISYLDIALWSIRLVIFDVFLILAWPDITTLFKKYDRNMGRGFPRIWAVARTTMSETWAARIWMLPVLWLVSSLILIFSVRPFDETERIPLYIKQLLGAQELLVLLVIWVMACVSLPRDRERKIVMTNASKPLSRLEILLGKITGFSVATCLSLTVMALISFVVLFIADSIMRGEAARAYEVQKRDFAQKMQAPSEGLKQLSEEGSLFAYNYIAVPPENFSILGGFIPRKDERALRFLKGGSDEKILYKFSPDLRAPVAMSFAPVGTRPYFEFYYPYTVTGDSVSKVQLSVNAYVTDPSTGFPAKYVNKVIVLQPDGSGYWEPDSPDDLYSYATNENLDDLIAGQYRGEVTLEVKCLTPGILLQVLEGAPPDPNTGMAPPDKSNVYYYFAHPTPQMVPLPSVPELNPKVRGFERRDRQEIFGPAPDDPTIESAMYRFPADKLRSVPIDAQGNFTLTFNFETYHKSNHDAATLAKITVFSASDPQKTMERIDDKEVLEKRLMHVSVPAKCLGDPDPAKRDQDMYVMVACDTPGHSISLIEDSVRIELPPTPFLANFFKSEMIILLEAIVLITVSVVASVRLGWPVAMFCSAVCFIFGYFVNWILGLVVYGGLGALNYNVYINASKTEVALDKVAYGTWSFLGFIARLVPNFTIFREPQDYIARLQNMPLFTLFDITVTTVVFILPIIGIGYLFIRKQELG